MTYNINHFINNVLNLLYKKLWKITLCTGKFWEVKCSVIIHTFYTTIFCSNENWKLYRAAAASEKVHNIYALEYLTTFGKILSIIYKDDVFAQANKSSFFDKTFKVKSIRLLHLAKHFNPPTKYWYRLVKKVEYLISYQLTTNYEKFWWNISRCFQYEIQKRK